MAGKETTAGGTLLSPVGVTGCGRKEEEGEVGERGERGVEGETGKGCWWREDGEPAALMGRRGLEGESGERLGEARGRPELGVGLENAEKEDWEGSTEQR